MAATRIYSRDIECESCGKVLDRAFSKVKGVTMVATGNGYVDVTHDASIAKQALLDIVKGKGYRASLTQIARKGFGERAQEFLSDGEKYAIERTMLRNAGVTLIILLALAFGFASWMDRARPGFLGEYVPWLVYLAISVVALGSAVWHLKAYRTETGHMTGMMIGMTIGMQTGMLLGAIVGATNGFFAGAMTGMLIGCAIGAWAGNCCGIMGVMEGLMAGIMGGTMGSMITFMMFNDHLMLFMPFYVALNLAVLLGLSYMLFEELVEGKDAERTPAGFGAFALGCGLAFAALAALIVLAPPSIFMGLAG